METNTQALLGRQPDAEGGKEMDLSLCIGVLLAGSMRRMTTCFKRKPGLDFKNIPRIAEEGFSDPKGSVR